jgi:rod shape-determining protein MreC
MRSYRSNEREGGLRIPEWLLVPLLVAGCFLVGRNQAEYRARNRMDPVTSGVQAAVAPTAALLARGVGATQAGVEGLFAGASLRARIRELEAADAVARQYAESIRRLEAEVAHLRRLQDFPSAPGRSGIRAEIIGFAPAESRITLSAGRRQGVVPGLAVMVPEGLLAVVQTVDAHRSQAMLTTNPSLRLSVVDISRNPSPAGLLQGLDTGTLSVTLYDAKATVQVGDRFVTAGFGPYVPRGILVGRVIQVEDNPEFGTRRALVVPAATVGGPREVVIVK